MKNKTNVLILICLIIQAIIFIILGFWEEPPIILGLTFFLLIPVVIVLILKYIFSKIILQKEINHKKIISQKEITNIYTIEFPYRGTMEKEDISDDEFIDGKDVYSYLGQNNVDGINYSWNGSNMTDFIGDKKIKNKISDIELSVMDSGICYMYVKTYEKLIEEEKKYILEYIQGQVSDGWGEGDFDYIYDKQNKQIYFYWNNVEKTKDMNCIAFSIHFWWNTKDWYIKYVDDNNLKNLKFKKVVNEYKKLTQKECYSIDLIEEKPGILDNKIGGDPYLPIGEEYPIGKHGIPMELLFQVNLSDIHLEGWPQKGILEIFISMDQNDFTYDCIVKLFEDKMAYQTSFPKIDLSERIIKRDYKIELTKTICHMPTSDYRFKDALWTIIEKIYNIKKDSLMPLYKVFENKNWEEELRSEITTHLVTVGGYAEFVDTCSINDKDIDKKEILFKLDPNKSPINFDIIHDNILNVVITKNDILSLNFDNVKIFYD